MRNPTAKPPESGLAAPIERAVQRVGAYTALPSLIRQLDADPTPILNAAGVLPDALDDPNARVPYAAVGRILHDAAARTRCAHFGLLAGRVWQLSDLGIVG